MQTRAGHPIQDFRRDLRVLEREMTRQLEGETTCCGVTLAQCHTLLELTPGGSLTTLAAALGLDTSTLSRTVDGLVRAGLVKRAQDTADRRCLCVTLTPAGRNKVAEIDNRCNRYYAALLAGMTERDRQHVVRAIRLLADGMRRLRSEGEAL
jgi:DNA-binding MarR family transcriptional regulator